MLNVHTTIRIASFAIASFLLACTATPRDGQRLRAGGQQVLFSGYVEQSNVEVAIQFAFRPNGGTGGVFPGWFTGDTTRSSTTASQPDDCRKVWYRWEKLVTLPLIIPTERSNFWSTSGSLNYQILTRAVKVSTNTPLYSFRAGSTCTPSRNCGDLVATECGSSTGQMWLSCTLPNSTTPTFCGD